MQSRLNNLLLTGRPGVGKTTLLERAVRGLGVPIGGFYTREIREKGMRVGFRLTTWGGNGGVLSHVKLESPFHVGKYGVDLAVIEEVGVPAVVDAVEKAGLIAIDELGRMELFSERFQKAILSALESRTPLFGVIQERAHPFLDTIRRRPDVERITVTVDNREELVKVLKQRLQRLVDSA
ncbi:MAG: NTPase [Nitrospiria bacterium]